MSNPIHHESSSSSSSHHHHQEVKEFHEILKTISTSINPIHQINQAAHSSIPHQSQYLLQFILDHHHSSNQSNFIQNLIQQNGFWSIFHQILSSNHQLIQSFLSKSSILPFIQISFNSLSSILSIHSINSIHSKYLLNSLSILINSISNRISFESTSDLTHSTLEVFINLIQPISPEFEEITLILINQLSSSLSQTSSYRKGFSLVSDHDFLYLLLSSISKLGLTSKIGLSLVQFITDCLFNIDQLKRSLSSYTATRGIEKDSNWFTSLRLVVLKHPQLAKSAIQLLPFLIIALIKERSVIQAHVFTPKATATSSTDIVQVTNLESSQDFILHLALSSHQLIQDLVMLSNDPELVEHAMNSIQNITADILAANVYSLASRPHFEVFDQIAKECVDRLIDSPIIASKSIQTLSDILTIDYRVIEVRLPQILQSLFSQSFNETSVIDSFLGSLIEWFSKAKQIPQFLNLIHDALDRNLSTSSLSISMTTPLNDLTTIRKLQHELLLSVSTAQLNQAHATASDRLLNTYRTIFPSRGSDDERSSKKSKRSSEPSESITVTPSLNNDATSPSDVDVARCVTYSHFYIVLATATARSLLHTQDPQLNAALDDTLRELKGMISDLCPESKKNKRARSSDEFLNTPGMQTVAASIFEILNAVSEIRHSTHNTPKELSKWLKFLSKAVSEKCELNPALVVQIAQAALMQISASVASDNTPSDLALLAYDIILQLLDSKSQADMDTVWNGAFHSLTPNQIPCAIWYSFSSIHLSEFSDLATTEQLQRLSRIILRSSPFQLTQTDEQNQIPILKRNAITFRQVNVALVSSPSFHELVRVCNSLLETGSDLLRQISSSYDLSTPPSRDASEKLLLESIGLFAILAKLPLDCLSKSTRIEYLQKSLDWRLKISSMHAGSSMKKTSKDEQIQRLVANANVYSIRYITSLICATETTADDSLRSKVISLTTLLLSRNINWELNDLNDVVYELSEIYIESAISFIFRSMNSLKLKSPKAWEDMSSVFFSRIAKASSHADHDVSNVKSNGLVIKALDSVINSISSSAPKRGVSDHQVHDSWTKFAQMLVQCTGQVVESVSMSTLTLDPFQLEICSSHFRLVRVVGSIGLQDKLRTYKLPISKLITLSAVPNTSSTTERQALVPSMNSSNQSLILKVVEEMLNMQRSQVTQTSSGTRKTLIKAFQTLSVLYIACLVHAKGDLTQKARELKQQYSVACRMVSVEEYSATLAALLEEYDRLLSSLFIMSKSARMDEPIKQLKATLEIASILILNAPEGLGKLSQSYLSSFIRRFQHPVFGSLQSSETILWRSRFLESMCTYKVKFIGRQDVALILELVLQSLALPNPNEEPKQTPDLTTNESFTKSSREIYQSLITIVSQLCRHRREHIIPVFHLLISILQALLRPICQPIYLIDPRNGRGSRNLIPSNKMIKEARCKMPCWAWISSINQVDWNSFGCHDEEVLAYNRLLIGLGIKTSSSVSVHHKKKLDHHDAQEIDHSLRPQIVSFLPALSKHAPFFLKEYLKLCTGFVGGLRITNHVDNQLKNGMGVLLSSMGKHERLAIGKMLGEEWILGGEEEEGGGKDRMDLELGKEVWRKMLNGWENCRYKGID